MKKTALCLALLLLFSALFCACGEEETEKNGGVNTAVSYTVTFAAGNGEENRVIEVAENSTIGEPTAPVKENAVFVGWKENGKTWYFSSDKVTKNTVLTASWVSAASVFEYRVENGEAIITEMKQSFPTENIRIPDVLDGYPVTTVEEEAFADLNEETLKSLTFGQNTVKVRRAAFAGSATVSLTFEAPLTEIGERAFYGCGGLTSITLGTLTDGTVPFDAFNGCANLTSIDVPEGTETVCENAFYGCSSLTWVILPASLTRVEDSAFGECGSLKSVYYRSTETAKAGLTVETGNGGNAALTDAKWYYYSAEKPSESGKCWYEKDGKIRFW